MDDFISKAITAMGGKPVGEEVKEEVVKEDSTVNEVEKTEDTVVETTETKEQTTESKDEVVEEKKEEKVAAEVKNIENAPKEQEVKEEIKETSKLKASEVFKKLNETVQEKYGISYSEAQRFKSLDVEKLKEEGQDILFEEGLRLQDPDITEKEISFKLKKYDPLFMSTEEQNEMIENGDITANQIEALDVEFSGTLRRFSKDIANKQNELDLDIELDSFSAPEQNEVNQPTEQQIQELQNDVANVVKSYDKETIKIVDKDGNVVQEIDYILNDNEKTSLEANMMSPDGLTKFWKGENKEEILKKLSSAMHFLENKEKMFKSVYDQGLSAGELKATKDISNIDFDNSKNSAPPSDDKYKSMREAYRQANGG